MEEFPGLSTTTPNLQLSFGIMTMLLGITRLNVYCGMAGFYVIRDAFDTGQHGNPLTLPTFLYETALAIQDRMFKANGELFYPAFLGVPAYAEFIADRGVNITNPTVLTEFFGYVCVGSRLVRLEVRWTTGEP